MKSYDNSHGAAKDALERRIAHAAEDVIENHVVDQIRGGKTRSKTRSCRFLLDVQKIIEDMNYMRRKAIIVKMRSGTGAKQLTYSAATPQISNKATMVRSDDVLIQLLNLLTGVPSSRRVIPVVGMGGIGKTTLATNAFKHPLIVHHFDVCLWATISQQYSIEKILTQLMSVNESTVDELGLKLHKSLFGRRYLIVLDDMWSVEAWDKVKHYFPDTSSGSRIVVTTRQIDVANHLDVSRLSSLKMRFLNKEKSWDLFCQKAFVEQDCPPELEQIAKKIVEKCKGLPLAIVVVGGHLRKSSMALKYWENVSHRMNYVLNSTENEQCLNILYSSYSYLPAHLKPFFLLIGAYPEDQHIEASHIFELWMSEGFIEPFDNIRLEQVAENYLRDLYERNLILVDYFAYNEKIYAFKVHDLLRELCMEIAKKEEFLYVFDTPRAINRERRAVICAEVAEVNRQTSESIFQQLNLRCLTVDLVDYKTRSTLYLPSSISLLWNLQILEIIVPNQSTVIAPYEIWEMLQLRHLEVNPICLVDPLPVDRSDNEANDLLLRNLHSLSEVENFRLSDEVCKRIPNIRGLELSYCDYCDDAKSYYCPNNLGNFKALEYLSCQFDNYEWRDFALSLTFPTTLSKLFLSGCGVDWEELTAKVGSLPNLLSLRLYPYSVIGSIWTPVEGKFLCLKSLVIWGLEDLIYWNADSSHFPVLQDLYLKNLSKLDEFPSGIGDITTFESIVMENCSVSSTLSAINTLMVQEEQGHDGFQLTVLFQGDEETLKIFDEEVPEESLTSKNLIMDLQTVTQ